MTVRRLGSVFILGAALMAVGCASTRGVKELDPKSRDFLSKARYTITAEERRTFLSLAPEAREAFIADFWERRDPTPGTPENEYKTDYFQRIERSNRLFSGGGSPGWLQDRGRVYITLGPPDQRITYPRGVTFYGLPTEIWWYGAFSILFIDEYWNDDYKIAPESAGQIAVITQAQTEWNKPLAKMPDPQNIAYAPSLPGLEVVIEVADRGTARIALALPVKGILLKAAGDSLRTTLDVTMTVAGPEGPPAWTFARSYPIDVPQSRKNEALTEDFTAEASAPLAPGAYTLVVVVVNQADGSRASVERKFQI